MARPSAPIELTKELGPDSTPGDRVRWLLEVIFAGNRSQMAAVVGCTSSYITKIAQKSQNPGSDVLEGLAKDKRINSQWLISGLGDPLRGDQGQSRGGGWPIPILNSLLTEPLTQPSALGATGFWPVGGHEYAVTRYFYRLQIEDRLIYRPQASLQTGDMLLLETDPNYLKEFEFQQSTPVVYYRKDIRKAELLLADRVYEEGDDIGVYVDLISEDRSSIQSVPPATEYLLKIDNHGKPEIRPLASKPQRRTTMQEMVKCYTSRIGLQAGGRLLAIAIRLQRTDFSSCYQQ